ncbi:MAG: hypothetical protein KDN05_08930 [Verrucomicrobiae bacterium]|nr:hypothetical protein [Verrucomicrobiae bacterium]
MPLHLSGPAAAEEREAGSLRERPEVLEEPPEVLEEREEPPGLPARWEPQLLAPPRVRQEERPVPAVPVEPQEQPAPPQVPEEQERRRASLVVARGPENLRPEPPAWERAAPERRDPAK